MMASMIELVGILNVTPDSFSDGGKFIDPTAALLQAEKLFNDGAALVDVGAESTRPNATPLSADDEWARLEPVLPTLLRLYPGQISLDSYHPETIRLAFTIGPIVVNDVTGMRNPAMIDAVVELQARCIISHLPQHPNTKGTVQAAHSQEQLSDIEVVKSDLLAKEAELVDRGLPAEKIILDPGIGFGKTPKLNRQLLAFADRVLGKSVMIGYSHKRFLGDNRMELAPNLLAGQVAAASGAQFLRVHDVAGHRVILES